MRHRNSLIAAGALAALGGWGLFRPEKLFINEAVQEKLPATAGQKATTLADGSFVSYAHETTGQAELVQVGGDRFVRLSDFKTSNGPDVHLYLVKGTEPDQGSKDGRFVDLGNLKGNVGDQNYKLPGDLDPKEFGSVAVWCKRFNVGFGGAELKAKPVARLDIAPTFEFAAYGGDIVVTSGKLAGGTAAIVEANGGRTLRLSGVKAPKPGLRVWLVKAETLKPGPVGPTAHIDFGPARKLASFPVSKDIDAWLYRSVALVDAKGNAVATTNLRSDQERTRI